MFGKKDLIRAHIIPKWCFRYKNSKQSSYGLLLTNDLKRRALKRSPGSIGVYDENILCAKCDVKFSKDEKLFKDFIDLFEEEKLAMNKSSVFVIENVNTKALKMFFISLLWKASISTHPFYDQVSCGPKYEEMLRSMILNYESGEVVDFSVFARKYIDAHKKSYSKGKFSPLRTKIDSINFYVFILFGFEFFIKVDNRKLVNVRDVFLLGNSSTWFIAPKEFIGSSIHLASMKLAKRAREG